VTGRVAERELTLDAPVDAVWRALTDAEELVRWFPLDARVTPGPGGAIWLSWEDHYSAESRIDVWEPGRRLRIAFPVHRPLQLATDYYLEGRGGRTVLRVVTSGFGDDAAWDDMYGGVSRGWTFELSSLRHYLERHRGRNREVAWARHHPFAGSVTDAWRRLTAPGGWLGRAGLPAAAAGDAITLAVDGATLTGPVLTADPPHQLVMIAGNLGDGLFRVEIEEYESAVGVVVWLASWRGAVAVPGLESRWRASLPRALSS
jgi:uncharacterized protein YndB with AHSA1/START domain